MKRISLIFLVICVFYTSAKPEFYRFASKGRTANWNTRIIGGKDAKKGQFPYQVSLRSRIFNQHFCGASILTSRFLLTAGHCSQGLTSIPDFVYAVIGTTRLSRGVTVELDKITPHKKFFASETDIKYDISLLRTASKIVFTDLIQPIALPTQNTEEDVTAIISGWGRIVNKILQCQQLNLSKLV